MSLSPPVKVTKLQLPVEQSLTRGRCNPPKKDTRVQRQSRSHTEMAGRATIMIKSNPHPPPRVGERAHRPQGWVVSGQRTTTEGARPHPSADNWIKVLLSKALPTRARLSFSHHQSLPSGGLHKPPSLLLQMADRRTTIPQWLKQKPHFGKTMGTMQEMFTKELKEPTNKDE